MLWRRVMEHGVEVHCNTCHGTFEAKATLELFAGHRLDETISLIRTAKGGVRIADKG